LLYAEIESTYQIKHLAPGTRLKNGGVIPEDKQAATPPVARAAATDN
jgi:hypothetical protein